MATVYRTKRISQEMAKFEHYRFQCEDCGIIFNCSKWDRFYHWMVCKLTQSILGGFRTAYTTLISSHFKKNRKNK